MVTAFMSVDKNIKPKFVELLQSWVANNIFPDAKIADLFDTMTLMLTNGGVVPEHLQYGSGQGPQTGAHAHMAQGPMDVKTPYMGAQNSYHNQPQQGGSGALFWMERPLWMVDVDDDMVRSGWASMMTWSALDVEDGCPSAVVESMIDIIDATEAYESDLAPRPRWPFPPRSRLAELEDEIQRKKFLQMKVASSCKVSCSCCNLSSLQRLNGHLQRMASTRKLLESVRTPSFGRGREDEMSRARQKEWDRLRADARSDEGRAVGAGDGSSGTVRASFARASFARTSYRASFARTSDHHAGSWTLPGQPPQQQQQQPGPVKLGALNASGDAQWTMLEDGWTQIVEERRTRWGYGEHGRRGWWRRGEGEVHVVEQRSSGEKRLREAERRTVTPARASMEAPFFWGQDHEACGEERASAARLGTDLPGLVHVVSKPSSTAAPSQRDKTTNDSLIQVMLAENLIPAEEESAGRVKALGKLNELVAAFVKAAYEQGGHGDLYNEVTSFRLRTLGSYSLDVHLPGADMNTVMVVPKHVSRKDMFSLLYPSMVARDDIKNLVKVEEARVPVIKFEMDGFEFDLAMARLGGLSCLPEDFDVTDDRYLKLVGGGDMQSITSLNGVRVTGMLPSPPSLPSSLLCPVSPAPRITPSADRCANERASDRVDGPTDTIRNLVPTMDAFKYCIRALKLWAKRRGVYNHELGFLGGISIEIMAARIGQMYPEALSSKLVRAISRAPALACR